MLAKLLGSAEERLLGNENIGVLSPEILMQRRQTVHVDGMTPEREVADLDLDVEVRNLDGLDVLIGKQVLGDDTGAHRQLGHIRAAGDNRSTSVKAGFVTKQTLGNPVGAAVAQGLRPLDAVHGFQIFFLSDNGIHGPS